MTEKKNLHQRLVAVMKELPSIDKDAEIRAGRASYKATTFDNVASTIKPYLVKHGISVTPRLMSAEHSTYEYGEEGRVGFKCDVVVEVTLTNVDDPADQVVVSAPGTGMDSQDKAPGKAFTYAFKYALRAPVLATTGENDEERPDHQPVRHLASPATTNSGAATDKQVKLLNAKGRIVYGDEWGDTKKMVLERRGLSSTKDLTVDQASKWIDQLIKKEDELALSELGLTDNEATEVI